MGFVSPNRNKFQTGGLQHLQARHILAEAGEEVFRGYFKFAMVRNPWDKVISQWRYLSQRPDLLGRFETLEADAGAIFTRIGLPDARLPHVTRSDRAADYRTYYDAGTNGSVAELYARDIALFGYSY